MVYTDPSEMGVYSNPYDNTRARKIRVQCSGTSLKFGSLVGYCSGASLGDSSTLVQPATETNYAGVLDRNSKVLTATEYAQDEWTDMVVHRPGTPIAIFIDDPGQILRIGAMFALTGATAGKAKWYDQPFSYSGVAGVNPTNPTFRFMAEEQVANGQLVAKVTMI